MLFTEVLVQVKKQKNSSNQKLVHPIFKVDQHYATIYTNVWMHPVPPLPFSLCLSLVSLFVFLSVLSSTSVQSSLFQPSFSPLSKHLFLSTLFNLCLDLSLHPVSILFSLSFIWMVNLSNTNPYITKLKKNKLYYYAFNSWLSYSFTSILTFWKIKIIHQIIINFYCLI